MLSTAQLERLEGMGDSMLKAGEGELLARLASEVPADLAIVEVGSYKGASTSYLGSGSRAGNHAPVFAVDVWDPGAHRPNSVFADSGIRGAFDNRIKSLRLGAIVTPIQGRSTLVARTWERPIGLLFIDARHDFKSAAADFSSWNKHVVSGGIVAFHDYGNPRWIDGVKLVVDEQIAHWPEFAVVGWTAYARKP